MVVAALQHGLAAAALMGFSDALRLARVVRKQVRLKAATFHVGDGDLEDRVLAHHPEAMRRRVAAEARIAAGDFMTGRDLSALIARTKREPRSGH